MSLGKASQEGQHSTPSRTILISEVLGRSYFLQVLVTLCSAHNPLCIVARKLTAVGFEPTRFAPVQLESTPLDHSGKLSLLESYDLVYRDQRSKEHREDICGVGTEFPCPNWAERALSTMPNNTLAPGGNRSPTGVPGYPWASWFPWTGCILRSRFKRQNLTRCQVSCAKSLRTIFVSELLQFDHTG